MLFSPRSTQRAASFAFAVSAETAAELRALGLNSAGQRHDGSLGTLLLQFRNARLNPFIPLQRDGISAI
jgi:hypothetical protein